MNQLRAALEQMKVPEVLYHASGYETADLKPGFIRTGVLVQWDGNESNHYLYATTDRSSALDLGFASALEKKFKLDRFITSGDDIKILASEPITQDDLLALEVWIYEISPVDVHIWTKNHNKTNNLDTEWRTRRTIIPRSCEKMDVASWLKTKKVYLKTE